MYGREKHYLSVIRQYEMPCRSSYNILKKDLAKRITKTNGKSFQISNQHIMSYG